MIAERIFDEIKRASEAGFWGKKWGKEPHGSQPIST